ncbi:MAG: XRE family transcriptional regulator [Pseudomonadota bacterium]|nr:XRE family transcriptional regulator [Pseudomonadota bacterium]
MTLTPGAYLKLRRCAACMSVADVAMRLSTGPRIAEHVRANQLELIEADIQPATFSTIIVLRHVFSFNLEILAILAEIHLGSKRYGPQLCRICACSEWDACRHSTGTCSWVAPDLCSSCAGLVEARAA